MKLTPAQLRVLRLMDEGWSLNVDVVPPYSTVFWKEIKGRPNGIRHKSVRTQTVDALTLKGAIKLGRPITHNILRGRITPAGRKALKEASRG